MVKRINGNVTLLCCCQCRPRIFYSNLQIYTTILKFIKTIPPPLWATVVVG
jgi:hypothetical protein